MKLKLIPRSVATDEFLDDYAMQSKDCEFVISLKPGLKEAEFRKVPVDVDVSDHIKSFQTIGIIVDGAEIDILRKDRSCRQP